MNFDGKAFVKNITTKSFASKHGYAQVMDSTSLDIDHICLTTNRDAAIIIPVHATNSHDNLTNKLQYSSGPVPHSVYIAQHDLLQDLVPQTVIVNNRVAQDIQDSFLYKPQIVYISRLQPTNIKYNPKSAIVINSDTKESIINFAGVSVDIRSKIEVVNPDKLTDYPNMSLVVQKNCFIEIKMSENVKDVINLPEALMYLPGYIKGTFTKSGEYNIKIKYPDGEQLLNIVVPYYQRLL